MSTPKEILLELLKPDGRPERQLKQYEAFSLAMGDPVNAYLRKGRARGTVTVDRWGTTISWPENEPGAMPITDDAHKVLKDITKWREQVHIPDLAANCQNGWEEFAAKAHAAAGDGKLVTGFMGCGIFEQCHYLMGFEDTLENLYEHPQEMHELIEAITEYRLTFVKLLIDGLHPDVILSHDDWGTKDALFMKADMWREFFKEPYRRFYGYIRSRGVITIHHADSYLVPIIEDMPEIGIQIWQGTLPENDIPALQKKLNGRMVLMGGVGAAIDREDSTPEEIHQYMQATLNANCPGGHYIPCITYGVPGAVFHHVDPCIDMAIDEYNSMPHFPRIAADAVPKRVKALNSAADVSAKVPEKEKVEETGILDRLADALRKGQRRKVLELTKTASESGIETQTILTDGLVKGMNLLGDDFSHNRAFVPEMLVAARCMTQATDYLRPMLAGNGAKKIGRVCVGTVKGDMHDIGKNLVKIMMDGSGLEVIDLGADVAPEAFIKTAIDQSCDIICCSALLTTTMGQMKEVVHLANEAGIHDKVKIMIGGAPISQTYCDEIGADIYTEDAASAARVAVELLSRKSVC